MASFAFFLIHTQCIRRAILSIIVYFILCHFLYIPKVILSWNSLCIFVPFPMYSKGYFVKAPSLFFLCRAQSVPRTFYSVNNLYFLNRSQFIPRDILSWNRLYSFCAVSNIFQIVPCHGIVCIVLFRAVPKEFR